MDRSSPRCSLRHSGCGRSCFKLIVTTSAAVDVVPPIDRIVRRAPHEFPRLRDNISENRIARRLPPVWILNSIQPVRLQSLEVDSARTVEGQNDLHIGQEGFGAILDADPQRRKRDAHEMAFPGRRATTIPGGAGIPRPSPESHPRSGVLPVSVATMPASRRGFRGSPCNPCADPVQQSTRAGSVSPDPTHLQTGLPRPLLSRAGPSRPRAWPAPAPSLPAPSGSARVPRLSGSRIRLSRIFLAEMSRTTLYP